MALKTKSKEVSEFVKEIFVFDEEDPSSEQLVYRIHRDKELIEFFPKDDFPVKCINLEGFIKIPNQLSEKGYFKSSLTYYFDKKFRELGIKSLTISKKKQNSIRKQGDSHRVVLNYDSLKWIKDEFSHLINESKAQKSQLADEFFAKTYPRKFTSSGLSAKRRAGKMVQALDDSIIEHLGPNDLDSLLRFMQQILEKRYVNTKRKRELFSAAKIKVDEVAIASVIKEFESLLKRNPHESKWGNFLEKNLYLLDSKYVSVLPELNVVLAGARNVDFGLVDSYGFLDLFEIKKPNTPLLSPSQDRGNYYWNVEATKAIAQAEKYLYNAERKASNLTEDIKRQTDITVSVIKPRAFLIMGMSTQLEEQAMQEDFRVLRRSLKNVEIILYDELLDRLKNQQNKIYID